MSVTSNKPTALMIAVLSCTIGLAACDRGNSRPANWTPAVLLKAKCKSKYAFVLDKQEKVMGYNQLNALDGSQLDNLVVRNYTVSSPKELTDSDIIEPATEKPVTDFLNSVRNRSNNDNAIHVITNCDDLQASYRGPGADGVVTGDITDITDKSITIKSENISTGENSEINVEHVLPKRKGDRGQYAAALKNEALGLVKHKVTITRSGSAKGAAHISTVSALAADVAANPNLTVPVSNQTEKPNVAKLKGRTVEIIQESTLMGNSIVEVKTSFLETSALALKADAMSDEKLQPAASKYLNLVEAAKASKQETVKLRYSELKELNRFGTAPLRLVNPDLEPMPALSVPVKSEQSSSAQADAVAEQPSAQVASPVVAAFSTESNTTTSSEDDSSKDDTSVNAKNIQAVDSNLKLDQNSLNLDANNYSVSNSIDGNIRLTGKPIDLDPSVLNGGSILNAPSVFEGSSALAK